MKIFLLPLTIIIGILIIVAIIFNTYSPISIPSGGDKNDENSDDAKGAIWKSTDAGRTFEPKSKVISNSSGNLSRNVISLSNGADKDIIAITSKGSVFRTSNWGNEWSSLLNSPIIPTAVGINPNNTNEIYIGAIESKRARLYRTIDLDKSNNWQEVYTEPKNGPSFVSIKVDPKNNNIVYALLSSGVLLKSYNKGLDWVLATNLKSTVIGLEVDSKNSDNILVVGITNLFNSTDGGFTFEESTPKLKSRAVTGSQITSFAVNLNNFNEIYLGSNGELLYTEDLGQTWKNVRILTPNLSLPITNISISESNANVIYYNVGTVLYASSNKGDTWNTSDLSLTVKNISDLLIDKEKSDIIYISSN
ncbi:MAG: YCF48-related protein [Candidatus Paceibacterota bacterium]